jgi:hypothetical protein
MAESNLTDELRTVEEELEGVRASVIALRRQVGRRSDGATDPEETAAAIRSADEQEALAVVLEARRDRLRRRLNEAS